MKKLIVFFFTLMPVLNLRAEIVEGYYISLNNDTIKGKIDAPISKNCPNYLKLTFEFTFSQGEDFKKTDRQKVKGFGFYYNGRSYDFITWNARSNKQIIKFPRSFDVDVIEEDGIYFVLRVQKGFFNIYALFARTDAHYTNYKDLHPGSYLDFENAADFVIQHPSKGMFYVLHYPKFVSSYGETLKFLDIDEQFLTSFQWKKSPLIEVVAAFNKWKK